MADIARKASVAFDALLQRGGHVVERIGEQFQVVVVGGLEASVEASAGDGLGCLRCIGEWPHGAAGCHVTEDHAEHRGDEASEHQRQSNAVERGVNFGEAGELEVCSAHFGQGDADDEHPFVADGKRHP
ncbi:unannotated protein [freshwater metagenome]|uniref:Unannotated protein n=1 Tax=freshwater metagenome TaxID=449393 RepID=A0A6J6X505_9ZZZZ